VTLVTIAGVAALYLGPAVVLVALLSARLYPGERMLERLRLRRAAPAAVVAAPVRGQRRPRAARRLVPRGSVLVAWSLAGRGPPALAAP
jgi:hypothetical protein